MRIGWRVASAGIVTVVVALLSSGVAAADNSNTNTNNNDVTNLGDPSNGAGVSETGNWPPTDLSWPPADIMTGGGENGGHSSAETPIVPVGAP